MEGYGNRREGWKLWQEVPIRGNSGWLKFSVDSVETALQCGESFRGSFIIYAPEGMVAEGRVYSSDPVMQCLTREFAGNEEEIAYTVSAEGMEVGEILSGKFTIISNYGEYEVPFRVERKPNSISSGMGEIRNMFHFANLARSHWEEAVRLFYSRQFASIFSDGTEQQYSNAYEGLSVRPGNQQNMEEFLLEIKKKQAVSYSLERKEMVLEAEEGFQEYELRITRSGWGYTMLQAEADGDFLVLEKTRLTEEDFPGNSCRFSFYIQEDSLHGGYNYGRIRFYDAYTDLQIPVTIHRGIRKKKQQEKHREIHRLVFQLMQLYCEFRGRQISSGAWLTESERILDRMLALDPGDLRTRLMKVQLLLTQDCGREAGWQLEHIRKVMEEEDCGPELWSYYLYLSVLVREQVPSREEMQYTHQRYSRHPEDGLERKQIHSKEAGRGIFHAGSADSGWGFSGEEQSAGYGDLTEQTYYLDEEEEDDTEADDTAAYADAVARKLEELYQANRGNWRIAWLLMHLSEDYSRQGVRRWGLLEEQFCYGCSSPVIYVEAWHLLEMEPSLLFQLSAFGLEVMYYAVRKGLVTAKSVVQIRYQIQKLKRYEKKAFEILKACYELYPDSETLHVICGLLIKGGRVEQEVFGWYQMAVEQDLRITGLYEYYMLSLPEDYAEELPRKVMMYFAYQSNLDYQKNAFLYAYICRRKEIHPEYYMLFLGQMEAFVQEQLRRGRINRHLVVLYEVFLPQIKIEEDMAEHILPLIFTRYFSTSLREIRQVVVRYGVSCKEYCYPVIDGRAYLPLYGGDFKILQEDSRGNRFASEEAFQLESLLKPEDYLELLLPLVGKNEGLDIYFSEGSTDLTELSAGNVERFRHMAGSGQLKDWKRSEISRKLMYFYYENDEIRQLDEYLEALKPEDMTPGGRREAVHFLAVRGKYDKAFAWIKKYGIYSLELRLLMRLCSRQAVEMDFTEDRGMTQLIYYIFEKGKYDANLLSWLVRFYNGTLKEMETVRLAADAFLVDTYDLCERMLCQVLITGTWIKSWREVYRSYLLGGAKPEVNAAFLARCCHHCFLTGERTEVFLVMEILRLREWKQQIPRVCKLVFLQYYAVSGEEMDERVRETAAIFLRELTEEGLCFGFFKKFSRSVPGMERFLDKTVIEYRGRPDRHPVIHYLIEDRVPGEEEYRREVMQEMYEGIYTKAFVLFFGEKVRYYITEQNEGEEIVILRGSQSADAPGKKKGSRFSMINAIVAGRVLGDDERVDHLLEEYFKKEYVVSTLFPLL